MTVLKGRKALQSLQKKGFILRSNDHNYLEFWHDGKHILHTFMSHNGQDINDFLISKMKKQCQLEKEQFLDLINCPLSKEQYIEILKSKGVIDGSVNNQLNEPKERTKKV